MIIYTSVALAPRGGHCELFLIIISRLMAVSLGYKDISPLLQFSFIFFLCFLFLFPKILPFFYSFPWYWHIILKLCLRFLFLLIFNTLHFYHFTGFLYGFPLSFHFPHFFLETTEQKRRNFCTRGGNPNISVSRSRSGLGRAHHGGNRGACSPEALLCFEINDDFHTNDDF